MAIFTIADLHLSLGENKPMDIFKGWNDYEQRIANNWKKIISENDTVVIPGDISWAMSLEEAATDLVFLNDLPGKKYILKGNHDYWWNTAKKMEKFFADNGLSTLSIIHNNSVQVENKILCGTRGWIYDDKKINQNDIKVLKREAGRLEASISSCGDTDLEKIVFMHYPPIFGNIRCEDIMDILHRYNIKRVYYGHIHGPAHSLAVNGEHEGIEFRLISCDYTDFTPIFVR